jgi:hypothetical protein
LSEAIKLQLRTDSLKKKTAIPAVKAKDTTKRINKHLIKMKNQSIANNIDWISIIIYALLVILGWLNIYSSSLSSWRILMKNN